jgi:hypothetical protein
MFPAPRDRQLISSLPAAPSGRWRQKSKNVGSRSKEAKPFTEPPDSNTLQDFDGLWKLAGGQMGLQICLSYGKITI